MMKDGKFKEDSAAVLSYQLHALAVKSYLSKNPSAAKKPTRAPSAAVARARREQAFYHRLAVMARVFPIGIGLVCLFILWDSQRRADVRRNERPAAASPAEISAVAPILARKDAPALAGEELLARSIAPRRAVSGSPSFSRLQSLLRGEPPRAESVAETAAPMSAP